jgi:hypothetical protein
MPLPEFYTSVSVTATNTNTAIILPRMGGHAFSVTIINDGPNEVFYDTYTGVATTSSALLYPGENRTLEIPMCEPRYAVTNVGLICSAAETATVRIYALPVSLA